MDPLSAIVLGAQALQAATGLYNNWFNKPEEPKTLSYDEALRRAQEVYNPLYDRQLRDTLQAVDNQNIARGFFGQAPGAALAGQRAADVEGARAAAIAQLANQMVGQSEQQALQQQQLAMQYAMNNWQQAQQAINSAGGFLQNRQALMLQAGWDPFNPVKPGERTQAGKIQTANQVNDGSGLPSAPATHSGWVGALPGTNPYARQNPYSAMG